MYTVTTIERWLHLKYIVSRKVRRVNISQ